MRKALHAADGLLLAHGFCDFTPQVGEFVLDVADDFALEPRVWRWNGAAHDPIPAPTLDERAAAAVDGKDRLLFEINFDQENRLRALEGLAAITRAQYRTALINRWKALN